MEKDLALHRLIGGIASDTKHILANQSRMTGRLDTHEGRLDALEKTSNKRSVLWGAVLSVFPFAFAAFGWYINKGGG